MPNSVNQEAFSASQAASQRSKEHKTQQLQLPGGCTSKHRYRQDDCQIKYFSVVHQTKANHLRSGMLTTVFVNHIEKIYIDDICIPRILAFFLSQTIGLFQLFLPLRMKSKFKPFTSHNITFVRSTKLKVGFKYLRLTTLVMTDMHRSRELP